MRKKLIFIFLLTICLTTYSEMCAAEFGGTGAFGDIINYLKRVTTSIIPSAGSTYDLGSIIKPFRTVYFGDMQLSGTGPDIGLAVTGGDTFGWHAETDISYFKNNTDNKYYWLVQGNHNLQLVPMMTDGRVGINKGLGDANYNLDVTGTGQFTSTLKIGAYTLPATDGTNGQQLITDGAGVTTWGSASGVSVSDTTTINLTLTGSDITADGLYTAGDALTLTGADIDFDGGISPGGSLGGTWASPTIDDLFLLNTGDTSTGALTINDNNAAGSTLLTIGDATDADSIQVYGDLTVTGGDITLGTTSIFSGGDTASLNNIDAIDATTETTLEAAIDTLGSFVEGGLADSTIVSADIKEGTIAGGDLATNIAITTTGLTTLNGNLQLGETEIKLDATLSGDETWSGITTSGTLGDTIAKGDLCYLNNDDGRWELADANLSDGYDKVLGVCLDDGIDGDATTMLLYGKVRSAAFPALTIGKPSYISETAGDITETAPVTTDSATRIVGTAITVEDLLFNPSNDYYTHT